MSATRTFLNFMVLLVVISVLAKALGYGASIRSREGLTSTGGGGLGTSKGIPCGALTCRAGTERCAGGPGNYHCAPAKKKKKKHKHTTTCPAGCKKIDDDDDDDYYHPPSHKEGHPIKHDDSHGRRHGPMSHYFSNSRDTTTPLASEEYERVGKKFMEDYARDRGFRRPQMLTSEADTLGRLVWRVYASEMEQKRSHNSPKSVEDTLRDELALSRELTKITRTATEALKRRKWDSSTRYASRVPDDGCPRETSHYRTTNMYGYRPREHRHRHDDDGGGSRRERDERERREERELEARLRRAEWYEGREERRYRDAGSDADDDKKRYHWYRDYQRKDGYDHEGYRPANRNNVERRAGYAFHGNRLSETRVYEEIASALEACRQSRNCGGVNFNVTTGKYHLMPHGAELRRRQGHTAWIKHDHDRPYNRYYDRRREDWSPDHDRRQYRNRGHWHHYNNDGYRHDHDGYWHKHYDDNGRYDYDNRRHHYWDHQYRRHPYHHRHLQTGYPSSSAGAASYGGGTSSGGPRDPNLKPSPYNSIWDVF